MLAGIHPALDPSSVNGRAYQFTSMIQHIGSLARGIVNYIAGVPEPLSAWQVVQRIRQLSGARFRLTNPNGVGYGDLLAQPVKQMVVAMDAAHYANVAALNSDLAAANAAFGNLIDAMEALLVIARTRGQLVDSDPVTYDEIPQLFSPADMAGVLAAAQAVVSLIDLTPET